MGSSNDLLYLQKHMPTVSGPVLEVGSKDYGNTQDFRGLYRDHEYIGVDMAPGKNVDVVINLADGTAPLKDQHFALIVCCSVLEHVQKPWIFADHLVRLLRPGGVLFISVPWVWRWHPYPDDYFRFSWRGVMSLFPDLAWGNICYSTSLANEFVPIVPGAEGVDDRMATYIDTPLGQRKYLPYLLLHMLGHKDT